MILAITKPASVITEKTLNVYMLRKYRFTQNTLLYQCIDKIFKVQSKSFACVANQTHENALGILHGLRYAHF